MVIHLNKVDDAQGVALQHRVDDCHIFLAVGIDVVALVFGLNGQFAIQTKQALTLQLVIDKALADVTNGYISP